MDYRSMSQKATKPEWLLVAEDEARDLPWDWLHDWNSSTAHSISANADVYADADVYANATGTAFADAFAAIGTAAAGTAFADAFAATGTAADVYADAFADADADPQNHRPFLREELHMKPGLYLYATPSSEGTAVLRVAWLRHAAGEPEYEWEALNSVTPLRGEYKTMLVDAEDRPPKNWKWTRPLARPAPILRQHIRHPVSLDEKGYANVCPKPKDWE